MKALFLVGGQGTRLRPFTNYLPKPMIPIMGRPLLERTCARLLDCGVEEVVMNPCYMPHKITGHFKDGEDFGLQVHYVNEERPLGTGGTIKNTQHHYDDSFYVFNGDVVCDVSLEDMMDFHRQSNADVTIAATYVDDPTPYGILDYDEDERILQFREKPRPEDITSHYINAGIYIFEPHVLEDIPAGRPVSVEREVFPALLEKGANLGVYRDVGYWMDIGTPEKYVQTHRDIFTGSCNLTEADFAQDDIFIDPTAMLSNNVYLDGNVFIGRDAQVDSYAQLAEVVVGDGAVVGRGSYLEDVIIWPGAHIPPYSVFQETILAELDGQLIQFPYESLNIQMEGSHVSNEKRQ